MDTSDKPAKDPVCHNAAGMTIVDSGTRRDFGTGSVRDAASGKGRMDLLPVYALDCLRRFRKEAPTETANPFHQFKTFLYPRENRPVSRRVVQDCALSLALWYLRGYRNYPYLEAATFFALTALEMEERHVDSVDELGGVPWCPYSALLEVSKLYEAGCLKYGDRNWEKGQPLHIYMDSGLRHLVKHMRGDQDEKHLVSTCWNFLCLLETRERIALGTLPQHLTDGMPSVPSIQDASKCDKPKVP